MVGRVHVEIELTGNGLVLARRCVRSVSANRCPY